MSNPNKPAYGGTLAEPGYMAGKTLDIVKAVDAKADKANAGVANLLTIVADKQRQDEAIAADIDSRLSKLEKGSSKFPVVMPRVDRVVGAIGNGFKAAPYVLSRFTVFAVITIVSIAGAVLGWSHQSEQPELAQAAWMAMYGSAGLFLPACIGVWMTRKPGAAGARKYFA